MQKSIYREICPRMYSIWKGMRVRCNNPLSKNYPDYGGRSIKVSKEWNNYEVFFWDMEKGYADNLTLERIDTNGNYSRANCRWDTLKEQANNRRSNVVIKHNGRSQTAKQWSEELGVSFWKIIKRVSSGQSVEDILSPRNI
jgi:hypothetical protein